MAEISEAMFFKHTETNELYITFNHVCMDKFVDILQKVTDKIDNLNNVDKVVLHINAGSKVPNTSQLSTSDKKLTVGDFINKHLKRIKKSKEYADIIKAKMLDFSCEINKKNQKDNEGLFLKYNINKYLSSLNLKEIKDEYLISSMLYLYSTLGDAHLKVKCLELTHKPIYLEAIISNEAMKLCMVRLGFPDFINADAHLAGTFFETIYYIAIMQKNREVIDLLNSVVFGMIGKDYDDVNCKDIFVEDAMPISEDYKLYRLYIQTLQEHNFSIYKIADLLKVSRTSLKRWYDRGVNFKKCEQINVKLQQLMDNLGIYYGE